MSKKNKKKTLIIIAFLLLMCVLASAVIVLKSKERLRIREAEEAQKLSALSDQLGNTCATLSDGLTDFYYDYAIADRVYSHRGSAGRSEHSFEAYDEAIAAGSHNIEQDVVISKDGTLYVSHNLTAADMTGDDRAYSEMSDAEIDALTRYSGGKILRLSEVFERYGRRVHYLIELKSSDDATVDAFKKEIEEHGVTDLVTAQALELSVIDKLEEQYPDMPKLLVVKTADALDTAMSSDNVDMVGARVQFVNAANCKEAHDRGKKFVGWTLDSEVDIRNAISIGADAYFTNKTALALELERKYRAVKTAKTDHSTLFFASDYQAESGFDAPKETLGSLLRAVVSDEKIPDKVILCGDYTNDATQYNYQLSPEDAIDEIKTVVREEAPQITEEDMLFVQGNHDKLTESITESGLHEQDNYLIYVINTENDFPWRQGKVSGTYDKVEAAAAEMKECFDALTAKGETRPVFIAGHVPLHFTARTSSRHTTGDNLYSSLVFDAVNEAAKSLDIVYLYGHNHSKGWDCYMGGAAVYRAIGEALLLPAFKDGDANTDSFEEKTLNFTYLNAGYTGYYMNCAPGENPEDFAAADEALTATVCEVYEDRIEIARYDANGHHVLGAAGAENPFKGGIDEGLIDSKYHAKETSGPAVIYLKRGKDSEALDEAA